MTELEFKSLALQGLQPHSADRRRRSPTSRRRCRSTSSSPAARPATSGSRYSFLLESVVGGERFGRYSFIGLPARTLLRVDRLSHRGRQRRSRSSRPTTATRSTSSPPTSSASRSRCGPGCRASAAACAGYFGYDAVRYIEPRLRVGSAAAAADPIGTPDVLLVQCEEARGHRQPLGAALPHRLRRPGACPRRSRPRAGASLALTDRLRASVTAPPVERGRRRAGAARLREGATSSPPSLQRQGVHRRRRPDAGAGRPAPDASATPSSPLSLYRALRSLNPSPYMYFYDMGDFQIVGASPEILVRREAHAEAATR